MWFMPYLRVRRAVLVYTCIIVGLSLAAVALLFWPGAPELHGPHRLPPVNLSMISAASTALVGGLATVLGLSLAAENDGHLEVAWTKPVSREGYALGVFAVDFVALAVCLGLTTVCVMGIVDVYAGRQVVTLGTPHLLFESLAGCGWPVCIYAWIVALSASLKRNRGTVAGVFWPLMLAVGALHMLPVPAVADVAAALNLFNPLAIYTSSSSAGSPLWTFAWGWAVAAVLLAAGVLQWRRLEL